MTYFALKQKPEHFTVTEILRQEPEGDGDFHYILFQKQGMTTMQLLDGIIREFGMNRNMLGIAGLKDKHAITQQWLSVARRDVTKYCGGINGLLWRLRKRGMVLEATYHTRALKLGDNMGNSFEITLVPLVPVDAAVKNAVSEWLAHIGTQGVPNLFGEQRFGFGGANPYKGFSLLSGETRNITGDNNTLAEKRFKVQAFASHVFNLYAAAREKQGSLYTAIPGDVYDRTGEHITGPVPGDDLQYATDQAGRLEWEVFTTAGITPDIMKRFARFDLFGIRRILVLKPQDCTYLWKGGNLVLSFTLGSGSYATVVVSYLEKILAGKLGVRVVEKKPEDSDKRKTKDAPPRKEKHLARKMAKIGKPAVHKDNSDSEKKKWAIVDAKPLKAKKKITDPVALAKHNHSLQERFAPNPNKKARRFAWGKVVWDKTRTNTAAKPGKPTRAARAAKGKKVVRTK